MRVRAKGWLPVKVTFRAKVPFRGMGGSTRGGIGSASVTFNLFSVLTSYERAGIRLPSIVFDRQSDAWAVLSKAMKLQ